MGAGGAGGTAGLSGAEGGSSGTANNIGGSAGSPSCAMGIDNCTSALVKTGAACVCDCVIGCGFQARGTKHCVCQGGLYTSCVCVKPPDYMGAPTAPYCDTPDGTTLALKKMPCAREWDECIGKDPVSGTTPQGCACLRDETTAQLMWACGSTNNWFALRQ
jgi:hypothetical protein